MLWGCPPIGSNIVPDTSPFKNRRALAVRLFLNGERLVGFEGVSQNANCFALSDTRASEKECGIEQ
jgi:hypothetical protein